MSCYRSTRSARFAVSCGLLTLVFAFGSIVHSAEPAPLVMVVMDPLSAPLACDCVQGYAQRKYEGLASHLQRELGRKVEVYWSESLVTALADQTKGRADLVVGKHSVVVADAQQTGRKLLPIAQLTGKDGTVTQTGLLVVRAADPAVKPADLKGYRIFFGPAEAEEKNAAARLLLKTEGVDLPAKEETFGACSEAAVALLELPAEQRAAAVISSYAQPLLEGCGSINKGDLRVIGQTNPVPFVTAFVREDLPQPVRAAIEAALLSTGSAPNLLRQLETQKGFVHASAE